MGWGPPPKGPCTEIGKTLALEVIPRDFGAQVHNDKLHGPFWS